MKNIAKQHLKRRFKNIQDSLKNMKNKVVLICTFQELQ